MQILRFTFLLLLTGALPGCGSRDPAPAAAAHHDPSAELALTFVLSGDTDGYIVPCGCTSKQFGGLPRRAAYLKSLPPGIIYADAGGSIARGTPYDAVKFEFILRGVALLHPAALNIGAGELALNAESLAKLARIAPLFSSNVRAKNTSSWPDHIVVKSADGTRVGFAGVCLRTAEYAGHEYEIRDAHAALQQLLPALAKEADVLVLLAYGDEVSALKLAGNFPELSALLLAGCGQSIAPRKEDLFALAGVAQKGKFMAHLTLAGNHSGMTFQSGEIIELSEAFQDDAEQLQNLASYKQRLKDAPLTPAQSGEALAQFQGLPAGYAFAGSTSCTNCHARAASIYAGTQHAHALETLHGKAFDFEPSCLKCHVTGYGGAGGFEHAAATPSLGGVGCENCHGPSQAHTLNPQRKTPFSDAKAACLGCHDPENSPKFEFAAYWKKIEHGREVPK